MSKTTEYNIQFIISGKDSDEEIVTGFNTVCAPPYREGQIIFLEVEIRRGFPEDLSPGERPLTKFEIVDIHHGLRNVWKKSGEAGIELISRPGMEVYIKEIE